MQTLSLQLLEGASSLTQLKTDRKEYAVGDRVVIAGNAYTEGYAPLIVPTLEGTLKIEPKGGGAKPTEQPLNLPATVATLSAANSSPAWPVPIPSRPRATRKACSDSKS